MLKYILAPLIFFANHHLLHAQLINYGINGKAIKVNNEKTIIQIIKQTDVGVTRSGVAALSLPSIITQTANTGLSLIKYSMAKKQEKYMAIYSASSSANGLIYIGNDDTTALAYLNIHAIDISRITDNYDTAATFRLLPIIDPQAGLFRFRLERISMPYTKAKRKNKKGAKAIDLAVDIKIDAFWKEPTGKTDDVKSFVMKNGTLGQSTIIVQGLIPNENMYLPKDHTSGWFQMIPQSAVSFANGESDHRTGWYTITISIKEVNPFNVNAKQKADFLNSNGTDLLNLLKELIPHQK